MENMGYLILSKVSQVSTSKTYPLFLLSVKSCASVAIVGKDLAVLQKSKNVSTIEVLRHE